MTGFGFDLYVEGNSNAGRCGLPFTLVRSTVYVMLTVLTESPEDAAEFVRHGELAAFPTETVYGLGADIFNRTALEKIFKAKRRPADNPLIAHISSIDELELLTSSVSPEATKLIERFFPGPLTIVFPRKSAVPDLISAGLSTIGVRMPRHPIAQAFLKAVGGPVAAPSANLSGRPSPTTWEAVHEDLDSRIACILKGGPSEVGIESTVVDCSTEIPVLLRPGAVTFEQLRETVPSFRLTNPEDLTAARSPGTRHRHYSPKAKVIVIGRAPAMAPPSSAFIGLTLPSIHDSFEVVKIVDNVTQYAQTLFDFFRECDLNGINRIYCERVPDLGLGRGLMDRLNRAAED